jgi:hypothetical protein
VHNYHGDKTKQQEKVLGNRRSGKEAQPIMVLFIGPSKILKDYYALGTNIMKTMILG